MKHRAVDIAMRTCLSLKGYLRNDVYCVWRDVKPYSFTHLPPQFSASWRRLFYWIIRRHSHHHTDL